MKFSFLDLFRHLPRFRKPRQWHFLLLFPWFIPVISYWIIGERYLSDFWTFVWATLLNLAIASGCQLSLDKLTQMVVRRYPNFGQTWQRVWRLLLVFMLVTPVFILGGIFLYDTFHLFGYHHNPAMTGKILLLNLVANLVSVGIDEGVYSLNKWRENTLEKEQLKKVNLQSQYESLKSQVNPHFLFNSLNSLSSLIADEPERAEEFVDEMSKVYRYLLQTNEDELTTLETELTFIQSYFHLLKTRYGAGIRLEIGVTEPFQTYRLPPLTLQMLVENAVKHNVIHSNKPLLIEIKTTQVGRLIVRNNLQRKTGRVASNQVGLSNILAKYRLLAQTDPIVTSDQTYFTVALPLLAPEGS
ncbi:histidine kinase [Larkinella arboricola]|uniref:Histidine kinase n=1 Tax=Larkinella arboricola TaxID=643671 RepID=A0A327WL51_LARAB|nr:histidine kinase [Larkinella arboricola]RAJ92485.1 histidine kinase [Larkinella arboricola]